MQTKILLASILFMGCAINAMEERAATVKMLTEVPSLKLLAAWQVANSKKQVTLKDVGDENLIDLLNNISSLSKEEEAFFKGLLNNPDLDIKKFTKLVNRHFSRATDNSINRQNLINLMLITAPRDYNKLAVKILLDAGADVNFQGYDGETSLMVAITYGQIGTLDILLEAKANVNLPAKDGYTALMVACKIAGGDSSVSLQTIKIMVRKLIEAGANVNACTTGPRGIVSNMGISVLMWAAERGDVELIQILIDAGADVNATTTRGQTALNFAKWNENVYEFLQHYN